MGLLNVGLKKEDRSRFDELLVTLRGLKDIISSLRTQDELVIRISLSKKSKKKYD